MMAGPLPPRRHMSFLPATLPPQVPSPEAWCFAFVQRELLLPDADAPILRPVAILALAPQSTARHYLGSIAALDCWALALPEVPPGWRRVPLRAAMLALDPMLAAVAGRAAQVLEWDRSHRF